MMMVVVTMIMVLGGVRDPVILEQFDSWFDGLKDHIAENVEAVYGPSIRDQYQIHYKLYGKSGVMGDREPFPERIGNEIGVLMVTLATCLAYLISDIAYAWLNPRIRLGDDSQ